ncbi:MAG: hypothetical protein Q9218_004927 [Villophora microphyllina]
MDVVAEESIMQETLSEISANNQTARSRIPRARVGPLNDSRSAVETTPDNSSIANDKYTSEPLPRRRVADPETIRKVETIVDRISQSLQTEDESVSIALRSKQRSGTATSLPSQAPSSRTQYQLSFPGKTPQEAWRFSTAGLAETVCRRTTAMLTCHPAVVLRILELVHEALVNNVVVSKRNIYYKDPELFKSQKVVDRYVDILSYTFGIQRHGLNVSTFRTLDASKIHENTKAGKGIVLTAKGYPDLSTRAFLRLLSISSHPAPSVFVLVDFDPDGIAIMSTYKHGSLALPHENPHLKTPALRWLGVKSQDLTFGDGDRTGLLQLSARDRKKAVKMLDQELCGEDGIEKNWRRELQVILMLNIRAEMEILSTLEGGLETWVEERICAEASQSGRLRGDTSPSPRDDLELRS